ncbi:EcsC family protein [Acinetobacter sp. LoGeW2-3]|uniref:EcsC family protein n=1 Tax=Acinetobacter sp. LoGeW2-3 TaxID=1808001 RepID=UPI000C05AA22|nr:EcsC family protein [Acinetobacter sp. LoGeW2-3]ATO18508.1 EcsC family protein [Acinetobacter sp. LoGeW2-3]
MTNTNNKQSNGFISSAFGVAKKFSTTGLDLLNHVAPDSVSKVTQALNVDKVINGAAQAKSPFESKKYDNPQQMLREHLPSVSRQLFGRHFNTVNNVTHFISPKFSEKVSDYFFDHLNQFTNDISSVDAILDEAGVRDLEELTQDVDRSKRISQAFGEQNKWIAAVQGAFSGATGVIGTAVDIPASLVLALRTIYQVGRSYGFDLSKQEDQDIVQHIFRQIDLSLIAEKQTVLLGLRALGSTLKTHDISQLQAMLGSSNDTELLRKFLNQEDGQPKWEWMNAIPKVSLIEQLSKLVPLAGAGVGAVYSRRFVDDVNQKAQDVFSNARQYLLQHRDSSASVLEAYEKSKALLQQAAPKLLENIKKNGHAGDELILEKDIPIEGNDKITQVKVLKKTDTKVTEEAKDEKVSEGLDTLADKLVEPVAEKHVQQPALSEPAPEEIEDTLAQAEAEGDVTDQAEVAASAAENDQGEAETETAQQKPKKATKSSAKKSTEDVTKDAD